MKRIAKGREQKGSSKRKEKGQEKKFGTGNCKKNWLMRMLKRLVQFQLFEKLTSAN